MKRFLILTMILAGGAVANPIVAWCCSRWSDHWPETTSVESKEINEAPAASVDYLDDPTYLGRLTPGRLTGLSFHESRSVFCTRQTFARWIDRKDLLGPRRSHEFVQFGFPFRSMQYETRSWFNFASYPESDSWRIPGSRGGWPIIPETADPSWIGRWNEGYIPPDHVYPTTLIPLGFIANTLVYAFVILALVLAPGALRRNLRHRKNLCSRCAYPLGPTLLCPECGFKTAIARP